MSLYYRLTAIEQIIHATGGRFLTTPEELDADVHEADIGFSLRTADLLWGGKREEVLKSLRSAVDRGLTVLGSDLDAQPHHEVSIEARLQAALVSAHERLLGGSDPALVEVLRAWTIPQFVVAARVLRMVTIDASKQTIDPEVCARADGELTPLQWLLTERLPNLVRKHFKGGSFLRFVRAYLEVTGRPSMSEDAIKKHRKRARALRAR
jgi:hypothetical protein